MKSKHLIPVLTLSLVFAGCTNTKENPASNTEVKQTTEKSTNLNSDVNKTTKVIYTSFYPIYNLTKQIAGDKMEVRNFSSLTTEAHGWEPSAKEMASLADADLLIVNGAGMEEWEDDVKASIDIDILDTSLDLELLEADKDGGEDHDHDHENEQDNHADHDHDDHDHNHTSNGLDPHTWLSPINASIQALDIASKLGEIDPENSDYYIANYQKIADELDDMVKEYKDKFEGVDNKSFIVNHKAFSYLANDFSLDQIPLLGISSTDEAGAKAMSDIIQTAKELGVKTIFYEKGGSDKTAKTIADEVGVNVESLNTMEFASEEDLKEEKTYQQLMRDNLEKLYQSMAK